MSNKTPMTFDQAASFGVVGMVAHQPAMSTSDTPTPRTDAAQNTGCWTNDTDYYVEAEFARQLERELTAALARIAELERDKARLDWLLKRGIAWRDCYDRNWQPGEWLYAQQGALQEIDAAMAPPPNTLPHA